jgi:hypothetical protein
MHLPRSGIVQKGHLSHIHDVWVYRPYQVQLYQTLAGYLSLRMKGSNFLIGEILGHFGITLKLIALGRHVSRVVFPGLMGTTHPFPLT